MLDNLNKCQLTIVCTTNKNYIDYTGAFLRSISENSPDMNVVVRVVNTTDVDCLKCIPNINLHIIYEDVSFPQEKVVCDEDIRSTSYTDAINIIKHKKQSTVLFKSKEAVYCSNIKFNTINKLINNKFECVLYLDVDTIVRRDISSLNNIYNNCDVATYVDEADIGAFTLPDGSTYGGWNAGFMLIHNNINNRKMFHELEERVYRDMFNFDADEIEFQQLIPKYQPVIRYIDKTYKDNGPNYDIDSHMWSGQANNKILNDRFTYEYNKYNKS